MMNYSVAKRALIFSDGIASYPSPTRSFNPLIAVALAAIFGFSVAISFSSVLTLPSTVVTLPETAVILSAFVLSAVSSVGIFFSRASILPTAAFRSSALHTVTDQNPEEL